MERPTNLFFILALMCGCAAPPAPETPVPKPVPRHLLTYGFMPGQELQYFLRTSYSSRALGDNGEALSVEHEAELSQRVLQVSANGRATIVAVLERLAMAMSAPGRVTVMYDSGDADGLGDCPTEMRGIAFIVGRKIELHQAPSGAILGVSGLAAIYRQALTELSFEERQPLNRLLRDLSHKPRGLFGLGVWFLPRGVRLGEEWSADRGPFPILCGELTYPCEYTLKEVSNGEATIEFRSPHGATDAPTPTGFKPLLTMTVQGTLSFDMKRGILTRMRGESSSFLDVSGRKELRRRTTWQLEYQAQP